MSNWLSQFESIGNNCEFGFVQRALGYEESSLLRWAFVDDIEALRSGLQSRFEGLFAFENLRPAGCGTMVRDIRAGVAFHSKMLSAEENGEWHFVQSDAERREIFEAERGKIAHLLQKFDRNIAGSDRIYVLKWNNELTHEDALLVLDAISARGGGRLLYVVEAEFPSQVGTVEMINPRLMRGWIDRLAPYTQSDDVSLACWEKILRAAVEGFSPAIPGPVKFSPAPIEDWAEASMAGLDEEGRLLLSALTLHGAPGQTNRFFDVDVYADRYFMATGERPFDAAGAVRHWLTDGCARHIVPSLFFDEDHYQATYDDVREASYFGFVHFLIYGMAEGRVPSRWFRHAHYAHQLGSEQLASYSHFLHVGIEQGLVPSDAVTHILRLIEPEATMSLDLYAGLMRLGRVSGVNLGSESYERLAMLFMPQWHTATGSLSPMQCFLTYASDGLRQGVSPGPLFNPELYRARAIAAGLPLEGLSENPLVHWLQHGVAACIVPTERFDEEFYRRHNPDIAAADGWGFIHFALHGAQEGRAGTKGKRFRQACSQAPSSAARFGDQYRQWLLQDFPGRSTGEEAFIPERLHRRLGTVLGSDRFRKIFADAQALDPAVGDIDDLTDYLMLPYYDDLALLHRELRARLPQPAYDSVICVPWIRLGGADLVAGLLANAILRVRPEEKLLILRTDNPHFERADWLPQGADVVHASDLFGAVELPRAQHLLKAMLKGIQAKRVFNVNSRLCWTLFRDHGAFMANSFRTYAYLFCWDHLPSGLRAGYPAEFFADTIEHLSGCMTDTVYLRDQLSQMYSLPLATQDRIRPLFTPAQSAVRQAAVAREVAQNADPATRRRVLWGGRLDRQKRFDLVIELARRMPDIEFWCWGAALLDQGPDIAKLPPNIVMQGTFATFDELPLTSAALWLFTALWEGMPTTLIELATRGVGVIASAVGGVPELITQETGWPVPEGGEAEIYERVLRAALADPEDMARRAEALQRRVSSMYNAERYDADIAAMLMGEVA